MTGYPIRGSALAALVLLACGDRGDPARAGSLDSAGIAIMVGPRRDQTAPWRVITERRLAVEEPDSPLHLVRWPGFVGLDSMGRVFVYNEAAERVEVFDDRGRFLAQRGRKGGGPGEYRYLGHLDVEPDGTLLVTDHGKNAVVGFDPRGQSMQERSFVELGYPYGGIAFRGDTAVIHGRDLDRQGRPVHTLRWISPGQDTALLGLRPETLGQAKFRCGEGGAVTLNGAEVLFAPTLVWAIGPTAVAAATTESYEVRLFISGRLRRLIRRPLSPLAASASHVRRLHPEGLALLQGRWCRQGPDALAAGLGIARHLPLLDRLRFAPDGTLWVQRFTVPGDPPRLDIIRPDGRYLGSITGVGFPAGFASAGRFLGLVADEESGAHRLYVYRLVPAPW